MPAAKRKRAQQASESPRQKSSGGTVQISKIKTIDEQLAELPKGLTFFDPILRHEVKEALETGGEAYLSQNAEGEKNGLFIYDNYEATGTIFTKSRQVFDSLLKLKPSSYIFSELEATDLPKETWNIWELDVDKVPADHHFKHHVSIDTNAEEIERFMAATTPETNPRWVRVALRHGDKCFVAKIDGKIVGLAWMYVAGGLARAHGLYVEPRFRRMGIMEDNLHARILYLKSHHVHTLIGEIADYNLASTGYAKKAGERIAGKLFLYTSPDRPVTSKA